VEQALYDRFQAERDAYFRHVDEVVRMWKEAVGPWEMQAAQDAFVEQAPQLFQSALDAMQAILAFNLEGTSDAARKAADLVVQAE
jgi:methyl-accepting chemotaxis protein-1 (serine sensor receptor)